MTIPLTKIDKTWIIGARGGVTQPGQRYIVENVLLEKGDEAFVIEDLATNTGPEELLFRPSVSFIDKNVSQLFMSRILASVSLKAFMSSSNLFPHLFLPKLLYRSQVSRSLQRLDLNRISFKAEDAVHLGKAMQYNAVLEELCISKCRFQNNHTLCGFLLCLKGLKKLSIDTEELGMEELIALERAITLPGTAMERFRGHLIHPGLSKRVLYRIYRGMLWRRLLCILERDTVVHKILFHRSVLGSYIQEPGASYVRSLIADTARIKMEYVLDGVHMFL